MLAMLRADDVYDKLTAILQDFSQGEDVKHAVEDYLCDLDNFMAEQQEEFHE